MTTESTSADDAARRDGSRLSEGLGLVETEMDFERMNEIQRRLHNAACVLGADGDEYGFEQLQRDAIAEIARLEATLRDKQAVLARASGWLHAAYDRPPQTPECRALLAEVDRALFQMHPAVERQRAIESAVRPACGVDPAARA